MNRSQIVRLETKQPSCVLRTMSIVGDKWTLLVIHELVDGRIRFCELQKRLNNINPRTLSDRLRKLEAEGVIEKLSDSKRKLQAGYRLTSKGSDLLPILKQMSRWGDKYPC